MKKFLYTLWELPQNLVGWFLRLILKGEQKKSIGGITVYFLESFSGGISLGNTILLDSTDSHTVKHEYGHTIQSHYFGPFYLLVIGLPSIIWAGLYGTKLFPYTKNGYYRFYTEKWADKLGGVER